MESGEDASVSAFMRHITPIKGSFAYKCAWNGLDQDEKATGDGW